MTKEDLLNVTLKQLEESFRCSPECFQLEDPELKTKNSSTFTGPTIIWKFRVDIGGTYYPDPNNASRTIIVTYTSAFKQMSCHIFFREVNSIGSAFTSDTEVTVQYNIPLLNESYRRFMRLKKKLIKKRRDKENMEYLNKLSSIFPTTFDDDLLK